MIEIPTIVYIIVVVGVFIGGLITGIGIGQKMHENGPNWLRYAENLWTYPVPPCRGLFLSIPVLGRHEGKELVSPFHPLCLVLHPVLCVFRMVLATRSCRCATLPDWCLESEMAQDRICNRPGVALRTLSALSYLVQALIEYENNGTNSSRLWNKETTNPCGDYLRKKKHNLRFLEMDDNIWSVILFTLTEYGKIQSWIWGYLWWKR